MKKHWERLLAFALVLIITVGVVPPAVSAQDGFFSGGNGTEDSPFLISTAADFDHIDDFYAACGDDLPSDPVYFTQTADILFYYNSENDNDGTAGYYMYDLSPYPNYTEYHPVRPTPAAVLQNAVYDGGGHTIRIASYLVDGEYTGVFGSVTDSTIRNLCARFVDISTDDPSGRMISTAENGCIGFVAKAQDSCFEHIEVIFYYDTFDLYSNSHSDVEYNNQAPFAGSAANCSVSDCLAWCFDGCGRGFIGGEHPTFTSHNTWAMHAGQNVTGVATVAEDVSCPEIDMHMREDGQIVLRHIDGDVMMLYDQNGVIVPRGSDMCYLPVYDPDTTGNVFTFCWAEHHTQFNAGAHGTLTGSGDYGLRVNRADRYCEITGLRPVADSGYVFSGWTNGTNGTLTLESDGTYTYRIRVDENIAGFDAPVASWAADFMDKAVLTANFAPLPAGYGFFSGGYGTEDNPFLISNAADFDHIDDFYAAYGDDLPCDPVYFTQTADIRFWYDDEQDNDGCEGYSMPDEYTPGSVGVVRTTPVSEMHNAVYDGGGHFISLIDNVSIVDSQYAGFFGHVTDSTIRNLFGLFDGPRMYGTAGNGFVGFIASAEDCLLQNIDVRVGNSIDNIYSETNSLNTGVLAGSADGCRVENCITQLNYYVDVYDAFIGGANPSYTFRDAWAQLWPTPSGGWVTARNVTGVIRNDTWAVDIYLDKSQPQQIGIPEGMVLMDTQGTVTWNSLTGYDPDGTGYQYDVWFAEDVTFEAGAHGTLEGAGSYTAYGYWSDPINDISGLKPIPDTGYVFDGWTILTDEGVSLAPEQVLARQSDGSFTYTAAMCGTVTVTANFALHETHTFGDWTVVTEATCISTGEKTRTCTACGYTESETIPTSAHSYDAVVTAPTCTEGGYTTYICSGCGETYTDDATDALGHEWGDWIVTTPATTEAAGEETRTCNRCRVTETRTIPIILSAVLTVNAPADPAHTGDTVQVTVDLTQNPGLAGMSLALSYDPDVLELTGVQESGMLQSGNVTPGQDLTALPYNILWEDALARTPHTETGTILTLTFAVKETAAAGETTVSLTYDAMSTFDIDLHAVPLTISGAALTVIRRTPGDADGDGEITLQDVVNLTRYLAGGWDVETDLQNSDVNGDGEVNLKDVVLLRRYLAGGWGVVLV